MEVHKEFLNSSFEHLAVSEYGWPLLTFIADFTGTTVDFINVTIENIFKLFEWMIEQGEIIFWVAVYFALFPITIPATLLLFIVAGFVIGIVLAALSVVLFALGVAVFTLLFGGMGVVIFLIVYLFDFGTELWCYLNGSDVCDGGS